MLIASLFLFFIGILAWILTLLHQKSKKVALFFTFLGMMGTLLGTLEYFTDYNLLEELKEYVKLSIFESQDNSETETEMANVVKDEENIEATDAAPSAVEVKIPDETDIPVQEEEINKTDVLPSSDYINMIVFLNVREKMSRDSAGIIHIAWTPMVNQDVYKLKVEIDDNFSNIDTDREVDCENSWCDIELSECISNTVIFISVGVYNDEISDWVYTDKTSFILF